MFAMDICCLGAGSQLCNPCPFLYPRPCCGPIAVRQHYIRQLQTCVSNNTMCKAPMFEGGVRFGDSRSDLAKTIPTRPIQSKGTPHVLEQAHLDSDTTTSLDSSMEDEQDTYKVQDMHTLNNRGKLYPVT